MDSKRIQIQKKTYLLRNHQDTEVRSFFPLQIKQNPVLKLNDPKEKQKLLSKINKWNFLNLPEEL